MYPGDYVDEQPDKAAVIMGRSGEVVSYRELDERSTQLARLLREAGLQVGDHIAVLLENHSHYLEVTWAALRSGLYVTPVNSFLTAPEVAYILNDCEAKALITSRAKAEVVAQLEGEDAVPRIHTRLMLDAGNASPVPGFEDYRSALAAHSPEHLPDETLGSYMFYSSGTTGRPKGILPKLAGVHPRENKAIGALGALYQFNRDMIYLSPAPSYHAAPLAFSNATLGFGGTVLTMEKFDAEHALSLIEKHRVSHSQWVPTMFSRMLKLDDGVRARYDTSSLEYAIHAAAPCPVPVKRQMIEWWGPILSEYYAGSEGNGSTFITSEQWLKKPGSVGRPMAVEIHICDDEGNELPTGEIGNVYFSGLGQFVYHNAPEKTAQSRLPGGQSTLGDVGYVDEDGYLFLTDRKAYMIISGGVNIYPQEIEDHIVMHPKVADVAVFGVPNEDFGEEVKAVVQPMPGVEPDDVLRNEILAFCREGIAGFKIPRSIDFDAELPRLPTGKLYKRLLRDRYWGETSGRIV